MSELLRVLKRPLVASSTCSAISTCCSLGSLASVCNSSHLCPSRQQRDYIVSSLQTHLPPAPPTFRNTGSSWMATPPPRIQKPLGCNLSHPGCRWGPGSEPQDGLKDTQLWVIMRACHSPQTSQQESLTLQFHTCCQQISLSGLITHSWREEPNQKQNKGNWFQARKEQKE